MDKNTLTLASLVLAMDNTPQIAALRSIVHSTMAKTIGAIRQDIRNRKNTERNADSNLTDLDQRNELDERLRQYAVNPDLEEFKAQADPLKQANKLHAVYDWANTQLRTLTTTKWEQPLNIDQMLNFMIDRAQPIDAALVKALADAVEIDPSLIIQLHEVQSLREREQLKEIRPEILSTFRGFTADGYSECIEDLSKVDQHQLAIKIVDGLVKAQNQVLNQVMRTKRMSDLGSIPLIKEATTDVATWVKNFETENEAELDEAVEQGRNLRNLEDVLPRKVHRAAQSVSA